MTTTETATVEQAATPAGRINMDEIVRIVTHDHGIYAYVEHTGGGCATIYAGAKDKDGYYQAAAGPGTISWDGKTPSYGHVGNFYVGPDDQGETITPCASALGAVTEAAIAELIVRQVRTGSVKPTVPLAAADPIAVVDDMNLTRLHPADTKVRYTWEETVTTTYGADFTLGQLAEHFADWGTFVDGAGSLLLRDVANASLAGTDELLMNNQDSDNELDKTCDGRIVSDFTIHI